MSDWKKNVLAHRARPSIEERLRCPGKKQCWERQHEEYRAREKRTLAAFKKKNCRRILPKWVKRQPNFGRWVDEIASIHAEMHAHIDIFEIANCDECGLSYRRHRFEDDQTCECGLLITSEECVRYIVYLVGLCRKCETETFFLPPYCKEIVQKLKEEQEKEEQANILNDPTFTTETML